jgi:hypothetical protein
LEETYCTMPPDVGERRCLDLPSGHAPDGQQRV